MNNGNAAGDPFTALSFYETGAFLPIFMRQRIPVEDVAITVNDGEQVAQDYYYSAFTSNSRTTMRLELMSTGINDAGIIANSSLKNHSGVGSEPKGCEWPTILAASIPRVLLVRELNTVKIGTRDVPINA